MLGHNIIYCDFAHCTLQRFFEDDLPKPDTRRLFEENSPEWKIMVGGLISSMITGGAMPVYAVLLGEVMGILAEEIDEAREDTVVYSWLFVGLGIVVGTAHFFQVRTKNTIILF